MPTSTDVTNLKINELTEAQYDSAVQGGVIGANELSVLTDVDDAIQVTALPTAGAGEVGKVYQFIGTTDANYTHGYFYECVSDGAVTPTYSWIQTNVQPGSSLPSQTGNAGKFLSTDGTDASWSDKPLVNTATGTNSLSILGSATASNYAINIGDTSSVSKVNGIAIGRNAQVKGDEGISIGYGSQTGGSYGASVAIGYNAKATGNWCISIGRYAASSSGDSNEHCIAIGGGMAAGLSNTIQLGWGEPTGSNTFWVGLKNNDQSKNYKLLGLDGTIPTDRLVHSINKYSTMPTSASTNEGWIVQYTGTTDGTYTHGYIYECVSDGGNPATYSWVQVNVQPASSGGGVPTLTWYSVSTAGNTLTIADTSSAQLVKIYKNGLLLQPTEDYTISGTTLTTVAALVVGDKITMEIF